MLLWPPVKNRGWADTLKVWLKTVNFPVEFGIFLAYLEISAMFFSYKRK